MAINSYTDLKTSVADYLARSDLTSVIPTFIVLAEDRINRKLRAHDMQTSASVTMSSGVGSLPADFLEWSSARWEGSSRQQDLKYREPNSEEWRVRYRPNGDPQMFSVIGNQLKIRPVASGNVTLDYYQKVTALTTANETNWLILRAPGVYLNYTLAEAALYLKDGERAVAYLTLAEAGLRDVTMDADTNKVARRPEARPADDNNLAFVEKLTP